MVPTLPVNGGGKVLKQELRQRARDALAPRHVRPFPAAQVTSRNALSECDPREAGLEAADVDASWGAVVRLYEAGLEPAAALCLRRRGKIVIDRAIGHVHGNAPRDPPDAPKVLARHNSLFNLFSASKAVTAMVVHLLDERRLVHLDDPVAEYIPEFGTHGKELITRIPSRNSEMTSASVIRLSRIGNVAVRRCAFIEKRRARRGANPG